MSSQGMTQELQQKGIEESENIIELGKVSVQQQGGGSLYALIDCLAASNLDIDDTDSLQEFLDLENNRIILQVEA